MKSLGQIAFEAYSKAVGSNLLWSALSDQVRAAWEAAAQAVADQVETVKAGPVSSKER